MILRNLIQGSDEWRKWRLEGGLGGSDVGVIMFRTGWLYPEQTYDSLLREKITGHREDAPSWAMNRGKTMEPQIRFRWQVRLGIEPHADATPPACVVHDGEPWMRASLDGLHGDRILEGKAPNPEIHNWSLCGRVPPWFRPQVQWQLLVSEGDGVRVCDYCSLSAAKETFRREQDLFACVTVRPDLEMQGELRRKCREFWDEVIAGRKERAK